MANRLSFFLGGRDLEMVTIRDLLLASGVDSADVHDAELRWGAKASAYRTSDERRQQRLCPIR